MLGILKQYQDKYGLGSITKHRVTGLFAKVFCCGLMIISIGILCLWVIVFDGYQVPQRVKDRMQWKFYNPGQGSSKYVQMKTYHFKTTHVNHTIDLQNTFLQEFREKLEAIRNSMGNGSVGGNISISEELDNSTLSTLTPP